MSQIDVQASTAGVEREQVREDSLRRGRLDPKLLYISERQSALWREVFLKHSPIHGNAEFARIYREAFAMTEDGFNEAKVHVVGLGCGTGLKEAQLSRCLRERGREVDCSAIDVSRDLVAEAARQVAATGARAERHLVCDLGEIDFLKQWLEAAGNDGPRVFTLFGLVPNLEPVFVVKLLSDLPRPGDVVLVSVHLAPVGEGVELAAAMDRILPQYDNAETLAWLNEAREELRLRDVVGEPRIVTSEYESIPCLEGRAAWKSQENAGQGREDFVLFRSLRYTPALFEELLRGHGLAAKKLAMTACREEAIWSVRRG